MRSKMMLAAALAVSTLAPSAAEAQTVQGQVYVQPGYGQPVATQPAPGYAQPAPRTEERVHVGLIVAGAVMFGVSWLLHALLISPLAGCSLSSSSGCSSTWEDFRWTGALPLVGPWIQLGIKPGGLGNDGWGPYLIIDGLLQAGGLTMLILGATITETVTVYGDNEGVGPSLGFGVGPSQLFARGTF